MAEEQTNTEGAEEVAGLPDAEGAEVVHEAAAQEATAPSAKAAAPAEPAEVLAPKERRQRARAAKNARAPAARPRTAEERHADRVAERRGKAESRRAGRQRARAKAKAGQTTGQPTPPREHGPGRQKTRQGVVVSDRADKTITVRIDVARRHRRYEKIVRTSTTLHAHDERNDAHIGDTVVVRESRPLSRTKRWRLIEVVERAR
jgi:small subunit ribosomal protein S17